MQASCSRSYFFKPGSFAGVALLSVIALHPCVVFNTKSINTGRPRVSIPLVSIRQIKAARALAGLSQTDLAKASGISLPTIKRLEAQDGDIGGRPATVAAIRAALEGAGVVFLPENGNGPGVALRKE
ncbi:MAG: helix-turn-helix domain-containing protein [Pseudotabrizicola sp.]|uniref:helix-turn-helix domain-containing protein n=1 Tax=Pseudotabrizicola sp. TaxID=2939647 RepID=UPI002718C4F1|nr:helix-turn-helix domain-containing protein [Pseudotabrizicola sp.]MDO9638118.1 helix-turn-helix domain-containing protein [Pseudotabrizicola sp.]